MTTRESSNHSADGSAVQIAQIGLRQAVLVTVITALAGLGGAYLQYSLGSSKNEAPSNEVESDISSIEREALYRLTAAYLEEDLALTAGKRQSLRADAEPSEARELDFRLLRRAVFLNMVVLRANHAILENTLNELDAQGLDWVAPQKSRVLSEFQAIQVARLRWLEDRAIPELQRVISQAAPMTQSVPSAIVPLPEEIKILKQSSVDEPTVIVDNMQALREEADLLERALSSVEN